MTPLLVARDVDNSNNFCSANALSDTDTVLLLPPDKQTLYTKHSNLFPKGHQSVAEQSTTWTS